MKLIAATNNEHKVIEFKRILEPLGYDVLSQKEAGIELEVEETGITFEENAELKAMAVFLASGCASVADDSGLEVDYLDRAPGIYSARFGGYDTPYADKCQMILDKLNGVPKEGRTARFVSAVCLVLPDGKPVTFVGTCEGFIGDKMTGGNGFGYDPIFMVNDTESFATLDGPEKDALSHRGNALRKLQQFLSSSQTK